MYRIELLHKDIDRIWYTIAVRERDTEWRIPKWYRISEKRKYSNIADLKDESVDWHYFYLRHSHFRDGDWSPRYNQTPGRHRILFDSNLIVLHCNAQRQSRTYWLFYIFLSDRAETQQQIHFRTDFVSLFRWSKVGRYASDSGSVLPTETEER